MKAAAARHLGPDPWPRRAATSTSCSRRSTSSRAPSRDTLRGRVALDSGEVSSCEQMAISDAELPRRRARRRSSPAARRWHAGLVGKYLHRGAGARSRSRSTTAREFRYRDPLVDERDARRRDHAVRRDRRHAGRAARGASDAARRSLAICNVVGSMATREADGAVYTHAGPGDRRRLDQGLHRAARRRSTCSRSTSAPARGTLRRAASTRLWREPARGCPAVARRALLARAGDRSRRSRDVYATAATSCSSAAGSTTRSRSRARSSSRRSPTSTPRATRPAR